MSEQESRDEEQNGGGAEEAVSEAQGSVVNGLASRLIKREILIPVAATAATALAGVAARKGGVGGKVKDFGEHTAEDLGRKGAKGAKEEITGGGGIGGVAGLAAKAIPGVGGGGGGSDRKKTRRLQIQRWTDVAVPVERAWETWMNFEDYPKFMHRVLSVQQDDDDENKITWDEKIWFSKRQWEAEIVEKRDNELISWKTTSGTSHAGLVSFHELDDNLTRVMVTMDFRPTGLFEKMGSGLRFVKRAVQADLARFKSYIEFQEAGLESPQERLQQVEEEKEQEKDEDKEKDKDKQEQRGSSESEDGGETREESEEDRDRESERSDRQSRREQRRDKTAA